MNFSGLALMASLLFSASSSPSGQWEWRRATSPSTATAEGLRLQGGHIACKVVVDGKTYFGRVDNGQCRYYQSRDNDRAKVAAPGYDFLAAKGGVVNLQAVKMPLYGVPRGAVREAWGDSGRVLCFGRATVGWLYRQTCYDVVNHDSDDPGGISIFLTTPATSFVDLPVLWRDLNTTGGTSGHLGYCRARVTSTGPKMAPGIFSEESGGTCTFLVGMSSSGAATFAKTTDKTRFTVLFASTNTSSERLVPWGVNSNARLRAGVVGAEHAYACSNNATKGVFLRDVCVAPPASGSGAGTVLPGAISEAPEGTRLLTVFGDAGR
jgi:hypothetical protein